MGNELMAPRKNRFNRNPESEVIAQSVIEAYKPSTVEDMQAALREVFGPMFEAMLKAELDAHLGYAPNSKGEKATEPPQWIFQEKSEHFIWQCGH